MGNILTLKVLHSKLSRIHLSIYNQKRFTPQVDIPPAYMDLLISTHIGVITNKLS